MSTPPPTRDAARRSSTDAVLDDLRRIVRVLRESSRAAEEDVGVTGAQLFVLSALAAERGLSINALAARTHTHQSTVSVVARRLVEHGLVARHPSPDDARRVELVLTAAGRARLRRAPLLAQERLIAGLEKLPARRRAVLAETLHLLIGAMGLADDPPRMFFDDPDREPMLRRLSGDRAAPGAQPARKASTARKAGTAGTVGRKPRDA